MTDREIIRYAASFRRGIIGKASSAMMCYAICAPLEGLLNLPGMQLEEVHFPEINHVWLRLSDGRILDPTADQFGHGLPPVYLGPVPGIYLEWIEAWAQVLL